MASITPVPISGNGTVVLADSPGAPNYGLPWVPEADFAEKDPAVIVGEVITDYQQAFEALTAG
jgi:hypothetical protein